MAEDIRIGMIGTNFVVTLLHLPSLKSHPRARLTAICGRNQERAQEVAKKFEIPKVFSDYREMIAKAGIDAVVIATPDELHFPMIMEALEAKLHVHCHPPLALNIEQAKEVCEKADASGVRHMAFFNHRIYPHYRYFKELIDSGYVGKLFHCHIQEVSGERLVAGQYSWRFDRARSLVGLHVGSIEVAIWCFGEIQKVSASLSTFKPLPHPEGKTYEPACDSAVLSVQFANGAHGTIYGSSVTHLAQVDGSISVSGEKGILELSGSIVKRGEISGAQTHEDEVRKLEIPKHFWEGVDQTKSPTDQLLEVFVKHTVGDRLFIDSIYQGKTVSPNFHDCLRVQHVNEAATEADKTGQWISL